MILINLLPEEFRVVPKTAPKIPVVPILTLVGLIFFVLTLIFYVDYLAVSTKWHGLEKKWKAIQPEYQALNKLQADVDGSLKQEKEFMERFVTTQRPLTQLMSWVSELLPATAWLTELRLERKGEGADFLVKGLALPSKEKSSIEQIESYLNQLKQKIPDATLSLITNRVKVGEVEVTEFIANFSWGVKAVK